jgi:hypothetical protein
MEPYRVPRKRNTLLYAQAVQTEQGDTIRLQSKKNILLLFMQRNATCIKPVSPFCFLHNGRIRKMLSSEEQEKLPILRPNRSKSTEESQLRIKIKDFKLSNQKRIAPQNDTPTKIKIKAASYFISSPRKYNGGPYYNCIHKRNASALMRSMITGSQENYKCNPIESVSFNGNQIECPENKLKPVQCKSKHESTKKGHKLDAFLNRIFPKRNYCCFSNLLGQAQFSYLKY